MTETTKLQLPQIGANQDQKHVTHNEGLKVLDAIVQLSVLDKDLTAAPGSPAAGDRYIVAASATGDWVGEDGNVAAWQDGVWVFYEPEAGWIAWVEDEQKIYAKGATDWVVGGGGGGGVSLDELGDGTVSILGVNATADATNKLSVNSAAALFNNIGNGVQLKVNKAAVADTASFLFQTNFSGRAEIGLTGNDDFSFKVSPDGSTFHEAMVIDKDSGDVLFVNGGVVPSRDAALNLLPDGGRLMGNSNNANISGTYSFPTYLNAYNGATFANYGEFTHNNSTYGGTGGALAADVDLLVQKTRGSNNKRYGPEFAVMTITQGAGTISSQSYGGDVFYLTMTIDAPPIPKITTSGFYLKMVSGKALLPLQGSPMVDCRVDGVSVGVVNSAGNVIEASDGWVWCEAVQGSYANLGYNQFLCTLRMTSGAVCRYAAPKITGGNVRLDGMELMPNDKLYA